MLCDQLHRVNTLVRNNGLAGLAAALKFVRLNSVRILAQWGSCGWVYACPDPSAFWVAELEGVEKALRNALAVPVMAGGGHALDPAYVMARSAWNRFYEAAAQAPCMPNSAAVPPRWVIRTHANLPPLWGETLCTPVSQPGPGETSYPDRAMCEYAMFRSPLYSTKYQYSTQCSPWGCGQHTYGVSSSAIGGAAQPDTTLHGQHIKQLY